MKKLTTRRLVLTPMSDEELGALAREGADEHLRGAYAEMLAGCRAHPADRLWYTSWRAACKDGTPVGDLGFKGPPVCGAVELGYGVEPEHRCRGYATEACQALLDWAFAQENVYFVGAETDAENETSQRVLQKLGFVACGAGAEGPRFEKEKPASSWLAIYMCLGMSLGLCFGSAMGSGPTAMSMGMCLGLALGAAMDAADKKKRAAIRAQRGGMGDVPTQQE